MELFHEDGVGERVGVKVGVLEDGVVLLTVCGVGLDLGEGLLHDVADDAASVADLRGWGKIAGAEGLDEVKPGADLRDWGVGLGVDVAKPSEFAVGGKEVAGVIDEGLRVDVHCREGLFELDHDVGFSCHVRFLLSVLDFCLYTMWIGIMCSPKVSSIVRCFWLVFKRERTVCSTEGVFWDSIGEGGIVDGPARVTEGGISGSYVEWLTN